MRSNVLIITPSRKELTVLSDHLQADYQVFAAGDVTGLLQVIGQQSIQVIICGAGWPAEQGRALCRQLKANSAAAHIPIILITAEDSLPERISSLEAGADSHIGGTLSVEHLQAQIKNLIANRIKIREYFARRARHVNNSAASAWEKEQLLTKLHECLFVHVPDKYLTVDLLAKLMHMSRPTLYRKMKSITDLTPNELINEARLKKAAELLAAGEYRVFEVARMVGYTSQSSFGKSFLKQFKVTPATYQRMKKIMDAA